MSRFHSAADTTAGDQKISGGAIDLQGNFIAVWTSAGQDGSGQGVYSRRYDSLGNPLGGEFQLNSTTAGDQTNAAVTSDKDGNFYVTWQSYNQDATGTWGIYGQQFSSTAAAIGSEFLVNSTTAGDQVNPATKMDSMGHLVIVWNGNGVNNTDGVFMQRYSVNTAAESAPVGDAWDPNGDGEISAAPVGHSPLGTNPLADAGVHSGSQMDFFGALAGPSLPASDFFNWNEPLNGTGANGSAPATLDAYFSSDHGKGGLTDAFLSGGKGTTVSETAHDELFALLGANGDNDLGDALAHGLRKRS